MPYCAIVTCKNDSRTKNVSHGGVSYHRFPKDPFIKEKWINATGRLNWIPSKISTICSEHFGDDNLQVSLKGYKYLKENAIPNLKILSFQDQKMEDANRPKSSFMGGAHLSGLIPMPNNMKVHKNQDDTVTKAASIERTTKLDKTLQFSISKIRKQNIKIRLLFTRNCKLKKKLNKLQKVLKSVEENFAIASEVFSDLKTPNLDASIAPPE